jgi:hypothetical protein
MTVANAAALPAGMQSISVPNNDGTVQVCDSMYTVDPSFDQKVQLAKHDGSFTWGIILFIVCLVLVLLGARAGYNSPAGSFTFIGIIVAGLACGAGGAACIDWAHTKQGDIKKSDYVDQMDRKGNLSEYWAVELFK